MRARRLLVLVGLVSLVLWGCSSSHDDAPPVASNGEAISASTAVYRTVALATGTPAITSSGTLRLDGRGGFSEKGIRATLDTACDEPYLISGKASLSPDDALELVPTGGNALAGFATSGREMFVCASSEAGNSALHLGISAGAKVMPTGTYHLFLLTRHNAWLASAAGTIVVTGDRYRASGTATHSGDGFGDNLRFSFRGGFVQDTAGGLFFDKLWRGAVSPTGDLVLISTVSDAALQEIGLCLKAATGLTGSLAGSYAGAWLTCDGDAFAASLQKIVFQPDGTFASGSGAAAGTYTLGQDGKLVLSYTGGGTFTGAVDPRMQVMALTGLGDARHQRIGVFVRR